MANKSGIEWTESTWNPVTGCTKVSQGCKNCYAERVWNRLSAPGQPYEGRPFTDVRCHPERLDQPLRWRRPRQIFVNSMSDLFHEGVPFEFIDKVFAVMALAWTHTFQVLTKRPERALEYLKTLPSRAGIGKQWLVIDVSDPDRVLGVFRGREWPLPNVWLGVSAEDQATARERIQLLLETPAAMRFVSLEPLLGPIDLRGIDIHCPTPDFGGGFCIGQCPDRRRLDWIIVGGESGPRARPMHPDWVRSIRDQCLAEQVPFFFKQWGGRTPKAGGKTLDGREWTETP